MIDGKTFRVMIYLNDTIFKVVLFKTPIFVLLEQAKFLLEKHRSYIGAKLGAFFENIL